MKERSLKFKGFTLVMTALLTLSMLVMPACSPANFVQQFDQYSADIVPALNAVLAILQFFGVVAPVGISAKVDADVKSAQVLVGDFASASAAAQPAVRAQIMAAEGVLNQDLASVFSLASVKDQKQQAHVQELINLIESAIQEGFNLIPTSMSKAAMASLPQSGMKVQAFRPSFNHVLTASWGNPALDKVARKHQLKSHSVMAKVIHVVSFGQK